MSAFCTVLPVKFAETYQLASNLKHLVKLVETPNIYRTKKIVDLKRKRNFPTVHCFSLFCVLPKGISECEILASGYLIE